MLKRCALLLLLLFPAVAEARPRTADLAVQEVSAAGAGEVRFTVVNRGGKAARAATLRVELGGATITVKQRALKAKARQRHAVRVGSSVGAGTWRARVCVLPRGERARGNDCASAAKALTIAAPTPAFVAPVSSSAGELIVSAAPAPTPAPVPGPVTIGPDGPNEPPVEEPQPTATATATSTPTPTPTATSTATPTATATSTPTPTATATATASPVASPSPSAPGDVATAYQQNPSHDGRVTGTAPAPPLAITWTKTLDAYPSAPVIADGRVFVVTIYGVLHALDLRNGAVLWKKGIGTRGGAVAYGQGRVYATDEYGLLYAIDAASGLTLWTDYMTTPAQPVAHDGRVFGPAGLVWDGATGERVNSPPSYAPQTATPAVDGARIYYGCQGASALLRTTSAFAWKSYDDLDCLGDGRPPVLHNGRLYATQERRTSSRATIYDAATGNEVGTFAPKSTPAFSTNVGLFVENGSLQARDASTYAAKWSFTGTPNVFQPPALIAGNDVYYSDADRLHVLDLQTGAQRWSGNAPAVMKGMAIAQGTLVLSTSTGVTALRTASAPPQPGPDDRTPAPVDLGPPAQLPGASTHAHVNAAHTAAINLSDPAPPLTRRWRIWIDARQAIVADGRIFAVAPIAARLNPATGATLWTYPGTVKHAAYDRGRLFITTEEEGLVALDPETGAKLWSVKRGTAAPVAADGELYVAGSFVVTRIDPATGAEIWRRTGGGDYPPTNRRTVSLDGPYVYSGVCEVLSRATGALVKALEGCAGSEHPFAPVSGGHAFESALGQAGLHDYDVERGILVNRLGSVAPPAIIGNLAITSGGEVKAYDFPSWTPRWKFKEQTPGSTSVPPLVVGRHVYFAYSEGFLRALDVETGRVVWSDSLGENLPHYTDQLGTSMAVGDGLLVVPTGNRMTAYESSG